MKTNNAPISSTGKTTVIKVSIKELSTGALSETTARPFSLSILSFNSDETPPPKYVRLDGLLSPFMVT